MLARLTGAFVVACALLTALPAGAAAKFSREPQKVYDDYRSDAAIQPCDHTVATYRRTLEQITPADEEQTPAFRPAVEAALRERARGKRGCLRQDSPTQPGANGGSAAGGANGGSDTTPSPPAQTAPAPAPAPAPPPASAAPPAPGGTAPSVQATPTPTVAPAPPVANSAPPPATAPTLLNHPHHGTPTGLLIALGLLALAALLVAFALLARRFGWADERLAGQRHAWGEATYRAGATWADFIDWIRLGRGPHRL
ncbi:MAG: hypothetical protein ABI611_15540 [Solirubrobacteraceae bacterium]